MVHAQAALTKQEKTSDVIIGHFLAAAAARENHRNYNVTEIDDYPSYWFWPWTKAVSWKF